MIPMARLSALVGLMVGLMTAGGETPTLGAESTQGAAADAEVFSTEDLIAGVEARSKQLATSRWEFTEEEATWDPPGPVAVTRTIDMLCAPEEQLRCTMLEVKVPKNGEPQPQEFTYAWEGKRLMTRTYEAWREPERRWRGLIAADKALSGRMSRAMAFAERSTLISHEPLAQLLREGKWETLGMREVRGLRAFGLRNAGAIEGRSDGTKIEIWLVPDRDFVLVELLFESSLNARIRDVELGLHDGVWVVSRGDYVVENPQAPAGYARAVKHAYSLKSVTTSVPADEMTFTLKYPVGAGVFDDIAGRSFIAGKAVEVKREDGILGYVPISQFAEYVEMTDYTEGLSDEEWEQTARSRRVEAMMND